MKKLLVNLDLCIGCKAHNAACHRVNHGTSVFRNANIDDVGTLPAVCRHCEDPACVKACPREAMRKEEDGTVRRSAYICSGCRSCVLSCPFGVLDDLDQFADFTLSKCHLCFDRVGEGKMPACVATCPTGAIEFKEIEDAVENEMVIGAHTVGLNPYMRRT